MNSLVSETIELYVEGTPTPINSPIIAHQRHNSSGAITGHETYLHKILMLNSEFPDQSR